MIVAIKLNVKNTNVSNKEKIIHVGDEVGRIHCSILASIAVSHKKPLIGV